MAELKPETDWCRWRGVLAGSGALAEHGAEHVDEVAQNNQLFKSYEEEAAFWDNLDTADMMEDDGEWFHFDVADEQEIDSETLVCRTGRR
jgi:hypothetical protein